MGIARHRIFRKFQTWCIFVIFVSSPNPLFVPQMKQELLEEKEVARKTRMELEAEVASHKKATRELEKSLEGLKVKNRIERDAINHLHVQTLKVRGKAAKNAKLPWNMVKNCIKNVNLLQIFIISYKKKTEISI